MILFLLPLKLLFPSRSFYYSVSYWFLMTSFVMQKTVRKLKNIDIAAFSADIASSMLCASVNWDNIDALSDCFNKTLTDLLDKFAPLKTRTIINRPKVPWFNDDIKQLKRQRRRLEKRAVKTDLPGDWNNYHKYR